MRAALQGKSRYIATPRHSKHRLFTWLASSVVPDSALVVIARDDDYMFGVLHSRVHELWARRRGTQVREAESGFRYTPQSTFEPFPFPWAPGQEPASDPRVQAIAECAKQLDEDRRTWLQPAGASPEALKERTLTALYNQSPSWLLERHKALDKAVLEAYGLPADIQEADLLEFLLNLNHSRAPQEIDVSQAELEENDDDPYGLT